MGDLLSPGRRDVFDRLRRRIELYRQQHQQRAGEFQPLANGLCKRYEGDTAVLQQRWHESRAKRAAKGAKTAADRDGTTAGDATGPQSAVSTAARSTQHAARSTQHAARSTQHAARSTQHAARSTQHAARSTQHAARSTQHAARSTQHAARSTQHAARSTQHAARSTQHAARSTQHAARSTQHAARSTQHAARSTWLTGWPLATMPAGQLATFTLAGV